MGEQRWITPWLLIAVLAMLTVGSAAFGYGASPSSPTAEPSNAPQRFDLAVQRGFGYTCRNLESMGGRSRYTINAEDSGIRVSVPVTNDSDGYFFASRLIIRSGRTISTLPLNDVLTELWTGGREKDTRRGASLYGPICIAKLDGESAPLVLVDQFSGGSEGANGIEAFSRSASGQWQATSLFTIGGAQVVRVEGRTYVEVLNPNWGLGSASFGGLPPQLLSVRNNSFVNETAQHSIFITRNASSEIRAFQASRADHFSSLGALEVWSADECELGNGSRAIEFLKALKGSGELVNREGAGPSGNAFILEVQKVCSSQNVTGWPAPPNYQYAPAL